MKKLTGYILALTLLIAGKTQAQTSIGIGTTTPDANAVLDINSTQKGLLLPRLNTVQQNTLASILTAAETGMIVIDANSGQQISWTGSSWKTLAATSPLTAKTPLTVASNNIKINSGTNVGDLLTWDGTNWVNTQPAVQHFTVTVDNHQPYLVNNYMIALFGIFPSQNDASQPYVGEIYLMGCNFAVNGFQICDGSLLSISANPVLFDLIGTTYGGNGTSTYAVPDLRGRTPIGMGSGTGLSPYVIGQSGGTETKTFTH